MGKDGRLAGRTAVLVLYYVIMSRAFVKEDGADPGEPVRRQASGRPNYVTPAGLAALRKRAAGLAELRAGLAAAQRPEEPRSLELRQAEADQEYCESQIKRAILVDNRGLAAADVRFGAIVKVRERDGSLKELTIVGEDEADPASGSINWASPLAASLLGKRAGDRVLLNRPGGPSEAEIIAVRYPEEDPAL